MWNLENLKISRECTKIHDWAKKILLAFHSRKYRSSWKFYNFKEMSVLENFFFLIFSRDCNWKFCRDKLRWKILFIKEKYRKMKKDIKLLDINNKYHSTI